MTATTSTASPRYPSSRNPLASLDLMALASVFVARLVARSQPDPEAAERARSAATRREDARRAADRLLLKR